MLTPANGEIKTFRTAVGHIYRTYMLILTAGPIEEHENYADWCDIAAAMLVLNPKQYIRFMTRMQSCKASIEDLGILAVDVIPRPLESNQETGVHGDIREIVGYEVSKLYFKDRTVAVFISKLAKDKLNLVYIK